ncbi:Aste57867_21864 [Aphanomyces stellatus]|uniref:Aste57867_21864 protein n=1 Tax=Aphanomyces stellatus TaxID=120398 RepID=A0A485LIN0_9STRA|nr:hypothetical protein As57867_021795 [Aphanomyces stellatus]VFT98533.1 Aste57867_21864 [Aphanomyces stellatus]
MVKILGYGSLLSEVSARSTFGESLRNFRLGRVKNYRRVFALPGSIFFREKIANMATKEIAGLCVEPSDGSEFIVSVFEVPEDQLPAFHKREALFTIRSVPFEESNGTTDTALMCLPWNDDDLIASRGQTFFDERYAVHGLDKVWGWGPESGILPCRVYLRHCILSVQKLGQDVHEDFVSNTFLGDRRTPIKDYLAEFPDIMNAVPPPSLVNRYSG